MKQVSRVSLDPKKVDAIVLWSKNPAPLIPHLDELEKREFRYYFQFTLNDYPSELEPNIPGLDDRLETFLNLSRQIGSLRVVWRYDPIIISNITNYDFHKERFSCIAEELRGATKRVVVSIVDFYQKTNRRLSELEQEGFSFDKEATYSKDMTNLLKDIAIIARKQDMEIFTCAEECDFTDCGIPPGRCIDESLINKVWTLRLRYSKDSTQRKFCLCMKSKDIGINDTCIHGCPYCYATRNLSLAERRHEEHDPDSPALWGHPEMPPKPPEQDHSQMKLL